MAEAPIRVAAIGLGRLGLVHAMNLAHHVPGAQLALVVDVDEHAARIAGERCGAPYATDAQAALDDPSIQAVEICTASDTHADLIVAAARAGKAIFCEKPIALSLADADRALAAVERAGVPLQIGFMRRYDAAFREAKHLIDQGKIGRPLTFRSASLDGAISPSREFLKRCGGIFVDVALHDFDLARWLMGAEVREVHATGAVLVHAVLRELGDVDNAFVTLRFAGGGIGVVQVSHTAVYGYDIATEVLGDEGGVRAGDYRRTDLWRYGGDGRVAHDTMPDFPERFAAAYLRELVEFVACLREHRAPITTGSDARAALAIALAARRSLAEDQAVQVRDMV
ncbi:MAG TPA: inositol 2-dehydrogenase [Chloroflexota bacterium]|nr:inositol 2-dehydrogenase [Chloroflexota bacterium]